MAHTKLLKSDFEQIVQIYCLDSYLRSELMKKSLGNTNYHIWTSSGEYFVKMFEMEPHKSVAFEIQLQDCLSKTSLVPEIVMTEGGKDHIRLFNKTVVVMKKIVGKHIIKLNQAQVLDLAKTIAQMHKTLSTIRLGGREDFELAPEFSSWMPSHDSRLNSSVKEILMEMQRLNFKSMQMQIIHGDLNHSNILFVENTVKGIVDWGDAHKDYRVFDLAVLLASFFVRGSIHLHSIQRFLSAYEQCNKLASSEKEALKMLMEKRILEVIGWNVYQQQQHPEKSRKLQVLINSGWRRYSLLKRSNIRL